MLRLRACLGAGLLMVALFVTAGSARAATNVPCDPGALKAAITAANTAGGGTLTLASGCTYTLTTADNDGNGLPVITTPITLNGGGATITRSSASSFRIFEVDPPQGNLTLNNVTVSNGHSAGPPPNGNGGGIWLNNGGALTLSSATVAGNSADNNGGGISNDGGTVTLNSSALINNTAGQDGGGLSNGGSASLSSSTTASNSAGSTGGGISNFGGLTLPSSTISGNTSSLGGGLANIAGGSTTMPSTTISGNTATGSVPAGAGILNTNTLNINNSAIVNNRATGTGSQAGGLFNQGSSANATLTSTTVSGNTANAAPGGIDNDLGTVTLTSNSITGNTPTNCAGSPTPVPGCTG
jgi:hypothetical protein